ncbi:MULTISPECIES: hypothetical protein [unclassified Pseudoalteromonas]|uniref:hypothetical protein n=1 Tax=unclassified Pseudoalteromonas TaxID=194690 RepID=UPI000C07BD56|nr:MULTISPECIES: hypothetical protein [unclassified Pseudoalteromonas]MDP2636510.1 hypothetical protein [Pseudoalteromonas sp. 1_MG-2023]PHN90172.1 hypothetical protein CSC79_07825 [Pseudoalteromonas sp. 3D05]
MNLTNIPSSLITDPNLLKQAQTGTQQTMNQAEDSAPTATSAKVADEQTTQDEANTDETKQSTQQQMITHIKTLQEKIRALEADDSLTKADQQTQIDELQQELDEELVAIQLSVKKNVSTLMGSLFSSAGNTSSGLLFNHSA